jgi:hypothetical protein
MGLVETVETQHKRLITLRQLIAHKIPCILWGEDALAFGHCVPTMLFDQQILVPDELLDAAAAVLEEGEYKRTSDLNRSYIAKGGWHKGEYAFPKSIRLRHTDVPDNFDSPLTLWPLPRHILLLPQSYFALDTRSESRFQSLVPPLDASNAGILVPKYNTFLEGLVHALMYPPEGRRGSVSFHGIFIRYLVRYRRRGLRERAILSDIQTEDCTWYMTQSFHRNGFQITIQEYIRQKTLRERYVSQSVSITITSRTLTSSTLLTWYDPPSDSLEAQNSRLVALRQLIARDIPCILWGEDALFLAHSVSVSLVPPLDSSNADILVPNYNTFLEGLIHFWMYPPTGGRWTPLQFSNDDYIDDLIRLRRKGKCDFRREILSEIETEDCAWYLGQRFYSLRFRHYQRGDNLEEYKRQKELRERYTPQFFCASLSKHSPTFSASLGM